MIRWCAYCQRFLGESAPLIDHSLTHGICEPCAERYYGNAPPPSIDPTLPGYYRRLFDTACSGNEAACRTLLDEGMALGLPAEDLLLGVLQPALAEAGARWERNQLSVADEHRLSHWCEVFISLLPPREALAGRPLDLLLLLAPGNCHALGARIAAFALGQRGYACQVVLPSLPPSEIAAEAERLRPRWVGLSCALPAHVKAARAVGDLLNRAGFSGGIMLSGQAIRRGAGSGPRGACQVQTLEEAADLLSDKHPT